MCRGRLLEEVALSQALTNPLDVRCLEHRGSGLAVGKGWQHAGNGCGRDLAGEVREARGLGRRSEQSGPQGGLGHGRGEPWKALE